jgi:hypothetical protein
MHSVLLLIHIHIITYYSQHAHTVAPDVATSSPQQTTTTDHKTITIPAQQAESHTA